MVLLWCFFFNSLFSFLRAKKKSFAHHRVFVLLRLKINSVPRCHLQCPACCVCVYICIMITSVECIEYDERINKIKIRIHTIRMQFLGQFFRQRNCSHLQRLNIVFIICTQEYEVIKWKIWMDKALSYIGMISGWSSFSLESNILNDRWKLNIKIDPSQLLAFETIFKNSFYCSSFDGFHWNNNRRKMVFFFFLSMYFIQINNRCVYSIKSERKIKWKMNAITNSGVHIQI